VDFARGNGAFAADYPGTTNTSTGVVEKIGRTNDVGATVGLRTMFRFPNPTSSTPDLSGLSS
jgi:hypothetical protein